MNTVVVELDLVSAAVVEFLSGRTGKNASDLLVDFLANEVKQTSSCPKGETNPAPAKATRRAKR